VVTANRVLKNSKLTFKDGGGYNFSWTNEFDLYGYDAFPLGGVDTACFCGWTEDPVGKCIIPEALCAEKKLTPECFYELGSETGHLFVRELIDDWTTDGTWACPETDFSDSWGIVPIDSVDKWIQTEGDKTVNLMDLLTFGMAGLRIGNIATLPLQAKKEGVHPGN